MKSELENVVKRLDQMNIGSELFLKEKKKQDIVKDLKMMFGDNIVSEHWINLSYVYDSHVLKKTSGFQAVFTIVMSVLELGICC